MKKFLFICLFSTSWIFGMEYDWQNQLLSLKIPEGMDKAYSVFVGDDYDTFGRASNLGFAIVWQKDGKPCFESVSDYQDGFEGGGIVKNLSASCFKRYHQEQEEDSLSFEDQSKEWLYRVKIAKHENGHVKIRILKEFQKELGIKQNKILAPYEAQ